MEHRWYRRVKTPFSVNIHAGEGVILKNCRADNVSMGGIVIDIGKNNHALANPIKNGVVNIELQEKELTATLPSLVLRSNGKYLALMFIKHHPGLRGFLSKLRSQEDHADVDSQAKRVKAY